jgi:hypothetical protein
MVLGFALLRGLGMLAHLPPIVFSLSGQRVFHNLWMVPNHAANSTPCLTLRGKRALMEKIQPLSGQDFKTQ